MSKGIVVVGKVGPAFDKLGPLFGGPNDASGGGRVEFAANERIYGVDFRYHLPYARTHAFAAAMMDLYYEMRE